MTKEVPQAAATAAPSADIPRMPGGYPFLGHALQLRFHPLEFIEVDLGAAELNQTIHLSDLKLPKGVTAITHGDENPTIASITLPAGAQASEAAEGGEAGETPAA